MQDHKLRVYQFQNVMSLLIKNAVMMTLLHNYAYVHYDMYIYIPNLYMMLHQQGYCHHN